MRSRREGHAIRWGQFCVTVVVGEAATVCADPSLAVRRAAYGTAQFHGSAVVGDAVVIPIPAVPALARRGMSVHGRKHRENPAFGAIWDSRGVISS